jgi:hypothetical protein
MYDPTQNIEGITAAPKYQDVFLLPDTGAEQGYTSYFSVMPRVFCPTVSPLTPSAGVAFNAFFDCLSYPVDRPPPWYYPKFGDGAYVPIKTLNSTANDEFCVPGWSNLEVTTGIHGLQNKNLTIRFTPTDGADPFENKYFIGDLEQFAIPATSPLRGRVTHHLDLSSAPDTATENDRFKNLLFTKLDGFTPPGHPSATNGVWYVPKIPGIIYVKRRAAAGPGDALSFPGNVFLTKNLILIINQGDVQFNHPVLSPMVGGAPDRLFSVISLTGDIILATDKEIDAYLVALKRGTGHSSQGGRLLSAGVKKMNIFGGLAVWEMGLYQSNDVRTTMKDFPNGGVIRYNPRFNPSIEEFYVRSRMFIMEDKASSIAVTGGN